MRETRTSGSEGGVGFDPPFLPLSQFGIGFTDKSQLVVLGSSLSMTAGER